jgi:hypothetical protein
VGPTPGLPLSVRVRPFIEVNERCAASHLTAAELGLPPAGRQKEGPQLYHVIRPEGAVGDGCVRVPRPEFEGRDLPFCSLGDLQRMIDRRKGKPGVRKARAALKLIRVGSDSPQESLLRLAIVRAGLPEPELNVPIMDDGGARHHEPDLSYRKYLIGIEYEGEHHGDEAQVVRDIARSERYAALGWTEVRISKRHMHDDAKAAVAKVRTALIQAGWRPGQ